MARPRLTRALNDGSVTLVLGPAVSGKTVLLAEWSAGEPARSISYVPLGPLDNDPGWFWGRLLAALGAAGDSPGSTESPESPGWLREPDELTVRRRVAERLAARPDDRQLTVVLDRVDRLVSPDVCDVVGDMLVDLPDWLRIVLAGRGVPAAGLRTGLLRASDRLAEVRAPELAFTRDETARYLATYAALTDPDIDLAHERTGGWVGGLSLVGLALDRGESPSQALAGISGSNRYYAELLAAEVVAPLRPETRDFMLATSVVDTLDGGLADAVTDSTGGADTLGQLERLGVFIDAVDEAHTSFRYQPLFRSFLAHQLHLLQPEREVLAHRGAATEYEVRGRYGDAIAQLVAAGDEEHALELVLEHGREGAAESDTPQEVRDWLGFLQAKGVHTAAAMLAVAELCVTIGLSTECTMWLDNARRRLEGTTYDQSLLPLHALVSAYRDLAAGHIEGAEIECHRALSLIAGQHGADLAVLRARAHHALVAVYAAFDRLADARRHEAEAAPISDGYVSSHAFNSWLAYRSGQLSNAVNYAETLLIGDSAPWRDPVPWLCRGAVERERNQLAEAESDLAAAIEGSRRWGRPSSEVVAAIELALLRFSQGRVTEAYSLLGRARPQAGGPFLRQRVAGTETELALRLGDLDRARFSRREVTEWRIAAHLDVRLALADGRVDDAVALLDGWEAEAQSIQELIVMQLVRARIALFEDDERRAEDHLRRAVDHGRPEGFVQVFAADIAELEPVLRAMVREDNDPYVFGLLASVAELILPSAPMARTAVTLNEPLSDRELVVLRYLPTGLSNKRIAAELHMSVNTLKTHLKSIYRKLGARSRDESVARARELHLL